MAKQKVIVIVVYSHDKFNDKPLTVYNVTVKHNNENLDFTDCFDEVYYNRNILYRQILKVLEQNGYCVSYYDQFDAILYNIDWINLIGSHSVQRYYLPKE